MFVLFYLFWYLINSHNIVWLIVDYCNIVPLLYCTAYCSILHIVALFSCSIVHLIVPYCSIAFNIVLLYKYCSIVLNIVLLCWILFYCTEYCSIVLNIVELLLIFHKIATILYDSLALLIIVTLFHCCIVQLIVLFWLLQHCSLVLLFILLFHSSLLYSILCYCIIKKGTKLHFKSPTAERKHASCVGG